MSRGTQWDKLEMNGSDEYYEAMLPDFQLLEKWDEEHGDEWLGRDLSLKDRTQQLIDKLKSMYSSKVEMAYNMGLTLIGLRSVTSWRFEKTVEERLPFSYSTACNYINIAVSFRSAADAALFDSKVMYAMATKNFPGKVRSDMISRAKKGKHVTLEEVRDARDQAKREAAFEDDDNSPIEFEKTPYMELADRVKASLEAIVSDVEKFSMPEELSEKEEWRKVAVWIVLDKLVKVFEPED